MLRHIAWFNEAPVEPVPEGGLTSADEAVRRRCLIPAREMEKLGVECSVFGNLHDADPNSVGKHLQKLQTDIVVIGRISGPSFLKLTRAAKHLGCYVVVDCGHDEALPPQFDMLANLADQMVVATSEGAEALQKEGLLSFVIPDCDENDADGLSAAAVAHMWLDCFRKLKMKPPACANTNDPLVSNG